MNTTGKKFGGREKGTPNKSTDEIKALLDSKVDFGIVVEKLFELTKGVNILKTTSDGDIIYTERPDSNAAKTLLEFRFGKAKQQIEMEIVPEMVITRKIITGEPKV